MSELVQANARVPEAARPVLLSVASRLRDDPGFLGRLQAFLEDEAGGKPWADRIEAIEARLAALEERELTKRKPGGQPGNTNRDEETGSLIPSVDNVHDRPERPAGNSAEAGAKNLVSARAPAAVAAVSAPTDEKNTETAETRTDKTDKTPAVRHGASVAPADWPARAAAITISTGQGKGRKLTAEGAALFEEMVRAGVRNPEIARILCMAKQSVHARARMIRAASS